MLFRRTNNLGFTLVEVILVVSIIGIMSAMVLQVLNTSAQRGRAEDAVKRGEIEQAATALESFLSTDDVLPTAVASGGYTIPNPATLGLNNFMSKFPTQVNYAVDAATKNFVLYRVQSNKTYLKYSSVWAELRICASTTANIDRMNTCTQIF